ncbi:hypothetical protein ONE63_002862 [Megalurothrips usitatus]|uniref:GSKIP domain-containing protein n=1 Tax=Megalurothrips usitatus TaxID=439358 RepID=A0AAV7X9X9_9NEOP|nr:hypothetical protein ONE63_002862 [Megalurothrips usitatus]
MEDGKVLDVQQWRVEVAAVIHDINNHVQKAEISSLDITDDFIYFNVTTLEGSDYCIQMSRNGFLIAGVCHDSATLESDVYFETPYALLDSISPKYRESFARNLMDRLNALSENKQC